MTNSDQSATADDRQKRPWQFSIAFLLGLTAACAFVLGIGTWMPCFVHPAMAATVAAIIAWAYRRGRLAFRCSLIGGTATLAVAFIDWVVNVARLPSFFMEPLISVGEFLLFAIIGLVGGLCLASFPGSNQKMSPPKNTEEPPSQVSRVE